MKAKTLLLLLFVALLAGAAGWFAALQFSKRPGASGEDVQPGARKVLYYQSAMHPWIKSDQPGNCTICGMKLTPVYEGEQGFDVSPGTVALGSNIVQVINVQTTRVKRRPLERIMRVAGTIEENAARHRVLSAYVDGRIDKLFVNFVGAAVVEDEPLATLYSPMLLTAEREYVTLKQQLDTTSLPSLQTEQERLLASAAQRLRQYGLTEKQVSALAGKPATNIHTEIIAPMAGTVVARRVFEGQYVKEGDALFEIADFSTMWFQFDAYDRDLAWLRVGQNVEITTPAAPGKVFPGEIAFIDPNINDRTRSAKVRVEVENPIMQENGTKRRLLHHRLYAEALVQIDSPEALAVPRSAVLSPGGNPVVYVQSGPGVYEQRPVKLGRAGDQFWEVLGGLEPGEEVVTAGNLLIDAQAQLNQDHRLRDSKPESETPDAASETQPADLTEAQRSEAESLVAFASALAAALAADDLSKFNEVAARSHEVAQQFERAFADAGAWQTLVHKTVSTGHLNTAGDLIAARKSFLPFSQAVVELVRQARASAAGPGLPSAPSASGPLANVKIYRCPMTGEAWPGAPKAASWVQDNPPLRNPFFGAQMLECGSEVR